MSYVADTFASCLTHPFPSEGDITGENDSSNLYVNPLDGSGGGGGGGGERVSAEFNGVRKSASGEGSVLCAKGSQGEVSPRGSRGSLSGVGCGEALVEASLSTQPQADDLPAATDDAKPKHRKARFQQVSLRILNHLVHAGRCKRVSFLYVILSLCVHVLFVINVMVAL